MSYWQGPRLVLHDYRANRRITATPLVIDVLDAFADWAPIERAEQRLRGAGQQQVRALVNALVRRRLLERSDDPPARRPASGWDGWNPAAGLFHAATRDVAFTAPADAQVRLAKKARRSPPPPAVHRSSREAPSIALPPPRLPSPLAEVLRARRTWRRFAPAPLTLDAVSLLLGLTWGVQGWVDLGAFGEVPLKTSPSGGARHSIECYVVVRRVRGLPRGLYHYDAAAHRLVWRGRAPTAADIAAYVPHQGWMSQAGVLVFMSAVFARVQWRYPFARAYRTILAEAGHHGQTFCLLATSLGLAPFCTMAFADRAVERALGLDGVEEAVMYAVGAGSRPANTAWAPRPGRGKTPSRRDAVPGHGGPAAD